jgi:hypothetical protein
MSASEEAEWDVVLRFWQRAHFSPSRSKTTLFETVVPTSIQADNCHWNFYFHSPLFDNFQLQSTKHNLDDCCWVRVDKILGQMALNH